MMAEEEEEMIRLQQIREIEMEELQIEEVDDVDISSSDLDESPTRALANGGEADEFDVVIYNPCLVTMHSDPGEVDNSNHRVAFLDGGAILILPMFYVEGVVLLPEATLPLRITKPSFRVSVERALLQVDAPGTIGVVHVSKHLDNERLRFSTVGTTAEIQQYQLLEDGSLNMLTRGKQRFRLRHHWIDEEGVPCAEVQIIKEDLPLRTPRDAFGQLASITNFLNRSSLNQLLPNASRPEYNCNEGDRDPESNSDTSFRDDLSAPELQLHLSAIIKEELPLRTQRDEFGQLASISNSWDCSSSYQVPLDASHTEYVCSEDGKDSESISEKSFEDDLSPGELKLHESAIKSCKRYDRSDESTGTDSSQFSCELGHKLKRSCTYDSGGSLEYSSDVRSRNDSAGIGSKYQSAIGRNFHNGAGWKVWAAAQSKLSRRAPMSFWPHWVYQMYDSYCLAQRAAVMWKQIIGAPSMDDLAKKPELLSFNIASKIPVSESLRQELLEIDGVSHRLRREIELLECCDCVRCKTCQSVIAKRSEMLVMSSDSPMSSYMKIQGYAHQIKAFYKANDLALSGCPSEECSWFQGYAWTVATCFHCESVMGWLFTATDETLKPESFWAIQNSQVADT